MNNPDSIKYAFVYAIFRFLALIPLPILFFFSEGITFLVYRILGYRKKVVFDNLKQSFPALSFKELKHISRKYYRHLSVMIVENIYLRFAPENQLKKRLLVHDRALFDRLYEEQRDIIVVLGHFGNWEFGGAISQYIQHRGLAVYKKLNNPVFEKIYFDIRSRVGMHPVEMRSVFKAVIKQRQKQKPFALFMVADQSPMLGEQQYVTTFLNQRTGFYFGTEKLAKKFNMAVVYIELLRTKKGNYALHSTLVAENPVDLPDNTITERYAQLLEDSIKRSPRYWLWSHKRWKNKV